MKRRRFVIAALLVVLGGAGWLAWDWTTWKSLSASDAAVAVTISDADRYLCHGFAIERAWHRRGRNLDFTAMIISGELADQGEIPEELCLYVPSEELARVFDGRLDAVFSGYLPQRSGQECTVISDWDSARRVTVAAVRGSGRVYVSIQGSG